MDAIKEYQRTNISIHSLREERDMQQPVMQQAQMHFNPLAP